MRVGGEAGMEGQEVTFRMSFEQGWSQTIPPLVSIDLNHILIIALGKLLSVMVLKHGHKILLTLLPMKVMMVVGAGEALCRPFLNRWVCNCLDQDRGASQVAQL